MGTGDAEVARLAERQRGCVHHEQLLLAGLSRHAIAHRRQQRLLHPLHRAVYLYGRPRLEPLARETAAVLYLEGHGVLSGLSSAATVWEAIELEVREVWLTAVGREARKARGLRVTRAVRLDPLDIVRHRGLPVTSPARTAVDCAGELRPIELESLVATFRRRGQVTDAEILAAIDRCPRAKGVDLLRRLIAQPGGAARTRSVYERRLLALIRQARLPPPRTNFKLDGDEVDFYWPEYDLIVEFDGFAHHGGRRAFRSDRARDRRHGDQLRRTIRLTSDDIDHTPLATIGWIAGAIAQARTTRKLLAG